MTRGTPLALITACVFAAMQPLAVQAQQAGSTNPISVRVLEGDGALNDVRLRRGRNPVVQVVNSEGRPVEGATVTFLLPSTGASGSFADSGSSLTVRTDAKGTAAGRGFRPNRVPGQVRIRVTASYNGAAASTNITQTNVGTAKSANRTKTAAILALVGGAAVGGIVAATHGGKSAAGTGSSSSLPSPPAGGGSGGGGTTIVVGDPALGPPR